MIHKNTHIICITHITGITYIIHILTHIIYITHILTHIIYITHILTHITYITHINYIICITHMVKLIFKAYKKALIKYFLYIFFLYFFLFLWPNVSSLQQSIHRSDFKVFLGFEQQIVSIFQQHS